MSKPLDLTVVAAPLATMQDTYTDFCRDFPPEERISWERIAGLYQRGRYQGIIARNGAERVGYGWLLTISELQLDWLDYIAIRGAVRGLGYGSRMIRGLWDLWPTWKGLLLEIEKVPTTKPGAPISLQARRWHFYQRLGAVRLDVAYALPTKDGPVPMDLLWLPRTVGHSIRSDTLWTAVRMAFDGIHDDVPDRLALWHVLQKQSPHHGGKGVASRCAAN